MTRERGSALAVATFWPVDVSSWLCSRRISNCFCVCCDQSSIIRDGSFVPATSRARSNSAIVFVFAISMTLRLKSRTPSADAKNASCPACAVCSVAACPLFQLSRAALAALSAIFLPCSTWLMGMSFRPRWPRCVRGDLVPNATLVPFVPRRICAFSLRPARTVGARPRSVQARDAEFGGGFPRFRSLSRCLEIPNRLRIKKWPRLLKLCSNLFARLSTKSRPPSSNWRKQKSQQKGPLPLSGAAGRGPLQACPGRASRSDDERPGPLAFLL